MIANYLGVGNSTLREMLKETGRGLLHNSKVEGLSSRRAFKKICSQSSGQSFEASVYSRERRRGTPISGWFDTNGLGFVEIPQPVRAVLTGGNRVFTNLLFLLENCNLMNRRSHVSWKT